MQLNEFHVTNYRSINDSGAIRLEQISTLVGRNESGKTSLLRVLASLNPPGGVKPFTLTRDYPRDRKRSDFSDELRVLSTTWSLSDEERATLRQQFPRAHNVSTVSVARDFAGTREVTLHGWIPLDSLAVAVRNAVSDLQAAVAGLSGDHAELAAALSAPLAQLTALVAKEATAGTWATSVGGAVSALRSAAAPLLAAASDAGIEDAIEAVEAAVAKVASEAPHFQQAKSWVLKQLPVFVYLEDWETLDGHYVIRDYLQRRDQGQQTASDALFAKLLKVAELDAAELQRLMGASHEERKLQTNRASKVLTKTLRGLWTDRKITVELAVDGDHFDVVVSDEDTDALVPLDERSRGFKWYFSFFITFAADTQGGDKEKAILLLDEPGLFLHATAQANLMRFFETLPNQIVYTTHSPFMIDTGRMSAARTVNLVEGEGTTVTNDPTGDANTLFPLQAALGYSLSQSLFVGAKNIVIEGVTDFWYLSAASEYLKAIGQTGLKDGIVLTPAGGAQRAPYMTALLTAQQLRVVVLFDSESQTRATADQMIKDKLIRNDGILFVGQAFDPARADADMEDLLDEAVLIALIEEAYATELSGRPLQLTGQEPRILQRVERAFKTLGIPFNKTRPASLWMRKMGSDPTAVWSAGQTERFERLFGLMNAAVAKMEKAKRGAFC